MSARCKRKSKGGASTIPKRVTTDHSNVAKAEAREIRCRLAPAGSAPMPTPSPSSPGGTCPSTDVGLFPYPPAKRLRCAQHQKRGKRRTKEPPHGKERIHQTCDLDETRVECPVDTSGSMACTNPFCSTAITGRGLAILSVTSQQESSGTVNTETSPQEEGKLPSTNTASEKSAACRARLGLSKDATSVNRAGLHSRKASGQDQLVEGGAHLSSSSLQRTLTDSCVAATRNGTARAGDDTSVSVDSLQANDQKDLLAPASDPLSPTKKLRVLTESSKDIHQSNQAEDVSATLDDGEDESDFSDETEQNAVLPTGGSTQSCPLQTQERTMRPSTPTPRLLLNSCCFNGVRTPLAGSPLSMSSQASTNSAFSASPLTCCSSIGPSSVPATPSCWLSDELSPHQTRRHQTRDDACPAEAVSQREHQEDASLLLWKAVASSTPVRNSEAVPSDIRATLCSPKNEEEDGCATLLSLSFESSSLYNSRHQSYPDSTAAVDNCRLVARDTNLLSDSVTAEQATESACSRAHPFSSTFLKDVESAAAAPTANGGDHEPKRSSGRDVEEAGTREGRHTTDNNVHSFLESTGRHAASVGPAQHVAASEGGADVFSRLNHKDGRSHNDRIEESGEKHQSPGTPCRTLIRRRCSEGSSLSCGTRCSVRGTGAAAISLPLQLPIPARAPRGKPQRGQVACQQQHRAPLNLSSSRPEAAVENGEMKRTAAPAEKGGAVENKDDAAGKDGNMKGNSAATAENLERTNKQTEEINTHNSNFRLPTRLEHACNIHPTVFSEEGKHSKEMSQCRPQLPADMSFFGGQGETQQRQQAAALNAMERAAVRAKLAARAAAACAAVIDAAAAAARNAAAVSAANRDSAGTTAGDYTEYPDMQRNIHDDYDLFCNPAKGAKASPTGTTCSSGSVHDRGFDSAGVHEQLWKSLRGADGREGELLCMQTCPGSDGKDAHNLFYWTDTTENGVGQCNGRAATNDDVGVGCTGCTDSQESKSEQIMLEGELGAVNKRDTTDNSATDTWDVKHRGELAYAAEGAGTFDDSGQQPLQPWRSDSCQSPYRTGPEAKPPREGAQELESHQWTGEEALKASKTGFSRSSSMETDASRYTQDSTSSSCAHCSCSWCRKCTLSKSSSLASSPRLRSEYAQMSHCSCDRLAGNSIAPLGNEAGAQNYNSLSAVISHGNIPLNYVKVQPACLKSDAVDIEETLLQSTGRDPLKSTQAYLTGENNAHIQNDGFPKGRISGSESSAVILTSSEVLDNNLGSSQEDIKDISETPVLPAARETPPSTSGAKGISAAASESRAVASDKRRRHVILGAGRFGKVVLGQHIHSGLLVAVKIIDKSRVRGADNEKDNVNFRQEIEMHRRLPTHRNIVTVYDVYEDRKSIYLVMELCDRVSLLDKLAEEGPMREDLARQIFLQILAAVKHCHDHHVMHRDLKPENVLFAHAQQPISGSRRRVPPGLPFASALNRVRCECHLLRSSKDPGSPMCSCSIPRCFWMSHDDSVCEKQASESTVHCNASPGCCCAKWEIVHPDIWPCGDLSVTLHNKLARSHDNLYKPANDEGSNHREQHHHQGREVKETCIWSSSASNLSEPTSVSKNKEAQQQVAIQSEGVRRQIHIHGVRRSHGGSQLSGERVRHQRPAAQSGSSTPESIICESHVGERGAQPTENRGACLQNLHAPTENSAARDCTPCAVMDYCCCRTCQGHERAAKKPSWSTGFFSFHTSQRRDREEPPTVKLIDFGSACSSTRGQLRGTACGTTHYLAPEVLTGNYYDGFASDAWSLGVILFTMLSGAPPFDGMTHSHLTGQIVRGEYRMDEPAWWNVSADAKNLILRLLDVNPQTRRRGAKFTRASITVMPAPLPHFRDAVSKLPKAFSWKR